MKVIDLLNKIANDEKKPMKILFDGCIYEWRQEFEDYMGMYGG